SWMPAHAPGPPPAFFAAGRSAPADVPVDAKGLAWQSSLNRRAIGTATSLAHWGLPFKAHLR
ncbi:MAG: hypothetical protein WA579_04880, partial [Rhodomicrobium sp.]